MPASAAASLTLSPQSGTPDASPFTQVSMLGAAPADASQVTVTGSQTGTHTGRIVRYRTAAGASFLPDKRFARGETVTVSVRPSDGSAAVATTFTIAYRGTQQAPKAPPEPRRSYKGAQRFVSRRDLYPPAIAVSGTASPDAGAIFVAPKVGPGVSATQPGTPGPMILDPRGGLLWTRPAPRGLSILNFEAQTLNGSPVLTWWQGTVTPQGIGRGVNVILDSSYREIGRVQAGNGYAADLHEFLITRRNSAIVVAYTSVAADLSKLGGPRDGTIADSVLQEIDIPTGLVMFEWHGLGNLPPSDCYLKPTPGFPYDPFHFNSADVLPDGNLLVSARNTSALYKVDTTTGRLIWRLAGKRSNFRIGKGAGFAWQHDARLHPDGTISIFDNRASPKVGVQSRGLVLRVDEQAHRVSVVRQYKHPRRLLAGSQGDMQLLPNGSAFIGWGAEPYFSEFGPDGKLRFDARFPDPDESYRAFRAPWTGRPNDPPIVAVRVSPKGTTSTYSSWNGATTVLRWRVLAGPSAGALSPVLTAPRSGFETRIRFRTSQPYVAVQALDATGQVLGTSKPVKRR